MYTDTKMYVCLYVCMYVCMYVFVDRPVDSVIKMESDKADGKTKKKNKAGDLARSTFFIL